MGDAVQKITKAIISFFDLLEAEGRNLRQSTVAVVEGLIVVFFSMALIFVGAVVALVALYLWLGEYAGKAGSAAIVAVLFFILGAAIFAKAHSGAVNARSLFSGERKTDGRETSSAPPEDSGQNVA